MSAACGVAVGDIVTITGAVQYADKNCVNLINIESVSFVRRAFRVGDIVVYCGVGHPQLAGVFGRVVTISAASDVFVDFGVAGSAWLSQTCVSLPTLAQCNAAMMATGKEEKSTTLAAAAVLAREQAAARVAALRQKTEMATLEDQVWSMNCDEIRTTIQTLVGVLLKKSAVQKSFDDAKNLTKNEQ